MANDLLYTLALTRLSGFHFQTALLLYRQLGSGRAVYDHRQHILDVLPECPQRLVQSLQDWDEALRLSDAELQFVEKHHIQALCLGDADYPQRLSDVPDAPIVLFALGKDRLLNRQRVINIIGTRHATVYGQDLTRRLVEQLRQLCPDVVVVSGLAYGIDICAHREALRQGLDTVGVLAHGLDELYPSVHRDTARQMVEQGALLTEYMSGTRLDKLNFVRRNRIVAGISDATVLVESAEKGGGLITCRIAQDYNRPVMAFPGPVGAPYSVGCNALIRDDGAHLITSGEDLMEAMGWPTDAQRRQAAQQGIERTLFPDLTPDEERLVSLLGRTGDQQLSGLAAQTGFGVGQLTALLFQLEMKGVVRSLAGGVWHLLH